MPGPNNISFQLVQTMADVSTTYLTEVDLGLICRFQAPNHLAEIDPIGFETGSPGSIFYLPSAEDGFEEYETAARCFGLSDEFVTIMRAAFDQRIRFVRFDRDGSEVFGIEEDDSDGSIES